MHGEKITAIVSVAGVGSSSLINIVGLPTDILAPANIVLTCIKTFYFFGCAAIVAIYYRHL